MAQKLICEEVLGYPPSFLKKQLNQPQKEIEVRKGSMEIKSKNADSDFETIQKIVKDQQGYIQESKKTETNLNIFIEITIKVPSEKLLDLVEILKRNLEVRSYHIKNYRISIERKLDELSILQKSLEDYEKLR